MGITDDAAPLGCLGAALGFGLALIGAALLALWPREKRSER